MKVIGINGRDYTINLGKYDARRNKSRSNRSKFHLRARDLICAKYNSYIVLEEVKLPGSSKKGSYLYLDFFIPNLKLAVEVHGQQHYEYTPFFHKSRAEFLIGQNRDEAKAEWCELNNIRLVIFKYSETDDEWREKLCGT